MQRQTIIMTIPEDIPAPKFELFQKVRYGHATGVISGLEWIDIFQALRDGIDYTGWQYAVNYTYGVKPPEKLVGSSDSVFYISEDALEEVSNE